MTDDTAELMRRLYADNEQRMYRTALSVLKNPFDAEDAVQDSFVRAMALPDRLCELNSDEQTYYLCAIARNTAINLLKKKSRRQTFSLDEYQEIPSDTDIEETTIAEFGAQRIISVIASLENDDYEILWLYCLKELSANELSQLLGITPNTVRQRVFRAKKRLRNLLKGECLND